MKLTEFCVAMASRNLSHADLALGILWFRDSQQPGVAVSPGHLAKTIVQTGLGHPNSTQLGRSLQKTSLVLKGKNGLSLKPAARERVGRNFAPVLKIAPKINQDTGYLPKAVWSGTRGYVESIASQVNGCYEYGFHDGASVLIRRLIETLLIEVYEHEHKESRVKGPDGNYKTLAAIISDAVDHSGLNLSRDSKKALHQVKQLGDRAAHNRRYTTVKADLDKIESGVRLIVDELIQLAGLRTK